jgi:hypothetical protein
VVISPGIACIGDGKRVRFEIGIDRNGRALTQVEKIERAS